MDEARSIAMKHFQGRATLTVTEAAQVLGISRSSAYESVRTNQLPSLRMGGRVLIPTGPLARILGLGSDDGSEG